MDSRLHEKSYVYGMLFIDGDGPETVGRKTSWTTWQQVSRELSAAKNSEAAGRRH